MLSRRQHLHLHVYSKDLISDSLKKKKHYNSFHPSLGFFLPLETVKGWVEGGLSTFSEMLLRPNS